MNRWIKEHIILHPLVRKLVILAKRVTLPGFKGVPLYNALKFFIYELLNDRLTMRASSVAFFMFLAVFPGIIFLFTLLPYFPIEGLKEQLYAYMETVLPGTAFSFLIEAIQDILNTPRGGLLSVGFIMAFYFSTNGVNAIMQSFDKNYTIYKRRTFLERKWVAIKLTGLLFLLLLISIFLILIGDWVVLKVLTWMGHGDDGVNSFLLNMLRWLVLLLLFFFTIAFIYHYGPAVKKKWRLITPGSTLATLLSIAVSLIFAYFVNNFNLYNKVYGSIGAIMAVMLWIYLNSLVLLIGFELNSSIKYNENKLF